MVRAQTGWAMGRSVISPSLGLEAGDGAGGASWAGAGGASCAGWAGGAAWAGGGGG